jgi:putative tryptophan/tyrosine transport system substrate-binding protein
MQRRDFIKLLGGAAVAWPLAVRAQQAAMPVIGFLNSASPVEWVPFVEAFKKGLGEEGYVDGQNVAIEYRWAEGQYDQLPGFAAELVARRVSILVATGGEVAAQAAKLATNIIPIVFAVGGDPVKLGLVASLNRPGGNMTGVSLLTSSLASKRLEVLREVVPKAESIGMLVKPGRPSTDEQVRDAREAARALGLRVHLLEANRERDFERAFATLVQMQMGALLVGSDPFFNSQRDHIVALAARHHIPAIYETREFARAGGLMSYGTILTEGYLEIGIYAGKILKGARPADLPVQQATKVELIVNLKTAKTLGITVPQSVQSRADEVIE